MGYLPEAMRNYLARLGWGHGDDEIFSDAQAIEWFDIVDVVSAAGAARLGQAGPRQPPLYPRRRRRPPGRPGHRDPAQPRGAPASGLSSARLLARIPLVKEGAKTMLELADLCRFRARSRGRSSSTKRQRRCSRRETRARLGTAGRPHLAGEARLDAASPAGCACARSPRPRASASANSARRLRAILAGGAPRPTSPAPWPRWDKPRVWAASRTLFRKCSKPL